MVNIYKIRAKMIVDGIAFVEADSKEEALKEAQDRLVPDGISLDSFHIEDLAIEEEMSYIDVFEENLRAQIVGLAESYGLDPSLMETQVANLVSVSSKIYKLLSPSGVSR